MTTNECACHFPSVADASLALPFHDWIYFRTDVAFHRRNEGESEIRIAKARTSSYGISVSRRGFDVSRTHKSLLPVFAAPSIPFFCLSCDLQPADSQRVFRVHDQIGNTFTFPRARCMDMLRRRQGSEAENSCPSACFPRLLIGFVWGRKHNNHKTDYDVIWTVDWEMKFIERFPRWFPDTTNVALHLSCRTLF